jgi:hypothetical protein
MKPAAALEQLSSLSSSRFLDLHLNIYLFKKKDGAQAYGLLERAAEQILYLC